MTQYRYAWANNEARVRLKDRLCEIVQRLKMNSVIVRFIDNGEIQVISRNAIRRVRS